MKSDHKTNLSDELEFCIARILTIYEAKPHLWSRAVSMPRANHGLVFFLGGKIRYYFEGRESFIAERGDILKLPQDLSYRGIRLGTELNSYWVVDFQTTDPCAFARLPLPSVFRPSLQEDIAQRFRRMVSLWEGREIAGRLECKAVLYELLADLLSEDCGRASSLQKGHGLSRVTRYIHAHLHETDLNISTLCRLIPLSEVQLRRNFHKAFQLSPLQYINAQRIEKAKNLLRNASIPIQDLAIASGFASAYYFSRVFRQTLGLTPTEYRRRYGV